MAVTIQWLNKHIRPGGKWGNERVIIFTEYRATQKWLMEVLAAEGFTDEPIGGCPASQEVDTEQVARIVKQIVGQLRDQVERRADR